MRELLGGKGANLAEMTNLGMPVPQGFTITTEACTQYYKDDRQINSEIEAEIMQYVDVSTNGRLYSLLSMVGLEERLLKADEDVEKCMLMSIDYKNVHIKLAALREFTKRYIKGALSQLGITYDNY